MVALGKNLAVFRGYKTGKSFVTSAYCPHLGADLTSCGGGKVKGDEIVCPFHEWAFSGEDGKCTDIPYSNGSQVKRITSSGKMYHPPVTSFLIQIPENFRLKTMPSMEANGLIYVWYHAENSEPNWYPPILENSLEWAKQPGGWVYQGRNEYEVK